MNIDIITKLVDQVADPDKVPIHSDGLWTFTTDELMRFAALIEREVRGDAEPARKSIVIWLIERLIENPAYETTASDMEYWFSIHDALLDKLTHPAPAVVREPLPHDQLLSLWRRFDFDEKLKIVTFARAVERAHGIGGSDE